MEDAYLFTHNTFVTLFNILEARALCPVYDFYKQFGQEEMTLFRKTWCTFDYTSAEYAAEGGKYQRKHTLSDGDEVCDMRWFINK